MIEIGPNLKEAIEGVALAFAFIAFVITLGWGS